MTTDRFCAFWVMRTDHHGGRFTCKHVSFVADRIVFNVKGNSYRIVCAMDYQRQAMFIKFVGTHKEYDEIKVKAVK